MARKAVSTEAPSHIVSKEQSPAIDTAAEAANQLALIRTGYNQGRDLVNQMLGQAQAFHAAGDLLRTFGVSKLAFVKENKLYQELAGMKTPNGSELSGTWAEFCRLIGMSDDKANQDIANLRAFGEEALENMNRIGIGYRDLRQFRRFPADERTALIEAAKSGDKDELLDLAESMIAKHTKEKEELTKAKAELQADYEAQGTIIRKKDEKLNAVEKQLHKLQNRAGDWHPRATEIAIETTRHAAGALEILDKLDAMRNAILTEDFGEEDREAAIEAMAVVYYDGVSQIAGRIAEVMADCTEVFMGYRDKARPMLDVEAFQPKAVK
jgi:hypothetical protein